MKNKYEIVNKEGKIRYINEFTGEDEPFNPQKNNLIENSIICTEMVLSNKTCEHFVDMFENNIDRVMVIKDSPVNYTKAGGCVSFKRENTKTGFNLRYDVKFKFDDVDGLTLDTFKNQIANMRHKIIVGTHELIHLASCKKSVNVNKKRNELDYGSGIMFYTKFKDESRDKNEAPELVGNFINEMATNLLANQATEFYLKDTNKKLDCFNDTTMEEEMNYVSNYTSHHDLGRLIIAAFDNSYGTQKLFDCIESGKGVDAVLSNGKPVNSLYYSTFIDSEYIRKQWDSTMSDYIKFDDYLKLSDELLNKNSNVEKEELVKAVMTCTSKYVNRTIRQDENYSSTQKKEYLNNYNRLFNECAKNHGVAFTKKI